MAPDAYRVFRRPGRRLIVQERELPGHEVRIFFCQFDIGIHASHISSRYSFGVGAICEPLRVHVTAVKEEACRPILLHKTRTEHFGQFPQASSPPDVELPQPIPGRVEPLNEKGVVLSSSVYVRNAPPVDQDLRRPRQPLDHIRPLGHLLGGAGSQKVRCNENQKTTRHHSLQKKHGRCSFSAAEK